MSRASALARGRTAAELSFNDTCVIRRPTGETTDPDSGDVVKSYLDPDPYTGQKCRVQQSIAQADRHDVGENFELQLRLTVQLPMAVVGLEVGDEITVTAVGAGSDPDLVGRTFLVRDLFHKTEATARRVGVTERTD